MTFVKAMCARIPGKSPIGWFELKGMLHTTSATMVSLAENCSELLHNLLKFHLMDVHPDTCPQLPALTPVKGTPGGAMKARAVAASFS